MNDDPSHPRRCRRGLKGSFLKRTQKSAINPIYQLGSYRFDSRNYLVFKENETITLTEREAELLKYFLDNKNKVLKR